jgi:hypothetical protein
MICFRNQFKDIDIELLCPNGFFYRPDWRYQCNAHRRERMTGIRWYGRSNKYEQYSLAVVETAMVLFANQPKQRDCQQQSHSNGGKARELDSLVANPL